MIFSLVSVFLSQSLLFAQDTKATYDNYINSVVKAARAQSLYGIRLRTYVQTSNKTTISGIEGKVPEVRAINEQDGGEKECADKQEEQLKSALASLSHLNMTGLKIDLQPAQTSPRVLFHPQFATSKRIDLIYIGYGTLFGYQCEVLDRSAIIQKLNRPPVPFPREAQGARADVESDPYINGAAGL